MRTAFIAVACGLFVGCSRHATTEGAFPDKPLLLAPPVSRWPSNVVHAADVMRTSHMSFERHFAAEVVGRYFLQREKPKSSPGDLQPISRADVTRLLGEPTGSDAEVMVYRLVHGVAGETMFVVKMRKGFVVQATYGHGDSPPCRRRHVHLLDLREERIWPDAHKFWPEQLDAKPVMRWVHPDGKHAVFLLALADGGFAKWAETFSEEPFTMRWLPEDTDGTPYEDEQSAVNGIHRAYPWTRDATPDRPTTSSNPSQTNATAVTEGVR